MVGDGLQGSVVRPVVAGVSETGFGIGTPGTNGMKGMNVKGEAGSEFPACEAIGTREGSGTCDGCGVWEAWCTRGAFGDCGGCDTCDILRAGVAGDADSGATGECSF